MDFGRYHSAQDVDSLADQSYAYPTLPADVSGIQGRGYVIGAEWG